MSYFAVTCRRTGGWDWSRPMRRQVRFDEHAAFMDALVEHGFVVLGGPLGAGEDASTEVLLVVRARDESTVRARLAEDPWSAIGLLAVERVTPWTVLLDGCGRSGELRTARDGEPVRATEADA